MRTAPENPARTSDGAAASTVPRNAFRNRAPADLPVAALSLGPAQMFMKIPNPRGNAVEVV
jgi:hypothetical protein